MACYDTFNISSAMVWYASASQTFNALTLLVGRQEGHAASKKRWGSGTVICLERGANLHMAQLMPLPYASLHLAQDR